MRVWSICDASMASFSGRVSLSAVVGAGPNRVIRCWTVPVLELLRLAISESLCSSASES